MEATCFSETQQRGNVFTPLLLADSEHFGRRESYFLQLLSVPMVSDARQMEIHKTELLIP
jgi:hypothetical protein